MRKLLLIAPKRLRPRPWLADITAANIVIAITIMRRPKAALLLKAVRLELPELPARLAIPVRLEQLAPPALRLLLLQRRNTVSQFV